MLNIKTEMQNYIRRQSVLNPEKDIAMIDGRNRTEIYSIGDDDNLYVCYEKNGIGAEFERKLIRNNVKTFVAANIAKTNKVAIACCVEDDIYLVKTESPESVEEKDFVKLDFRDILGGKKLVPSRLLLSALDEGTTLFVEMKDEGGRIEQFSCFLGDSNTRSVSYFPLAANFSDVKCSAVGRAVDQHVDGVYTYGTYGETNQLLYTPSRNVFGTTPPAPIRLKSEYKVDSICALPLKTKVGTHLFSVGEKTLYLYPFNRQKDMLRIDNPDPNSLICSELFDGTKKIAAVRFDDTVYVYVLNQAGRRCYTFAECDGDEIGEFMDPVILMNDVYYFDISNQGSMNICQKDSAIFGKRNPDTGSWGFKSASLETGLNEYQSKSAYVTRFVVEKPFDDVQIEFEKGVVGCYVNDIYHNFSSMTTKADVTGAIKIVQIATSLTPPCFTVKYKNESVKVNPAEDAQKRILSLTDVNTLKEQIIHNPDGTTRNLFGVGTDDSDLHMLSSSIAALCGSVNSIMPGFASVPAQFTTGIMVKITDKIAEVLPYDVTHNPFLEFTSEAVKDIAYAVDWVASKVKYAYDHTLKKVVDFTIALVGDVWKFVVKIRDKILEVVVDTFEKVFSTVVKILEMIGIPVDKLFDWLKKSLNIDDVCRMNDCMKKILRLSSKKFVEITEETKDKIVEMLDKAIDSVASWADIDMEKTKSLLGEHFDVNLNALGLDCGPQGTYMFDTIFGVTSFDDIQLPNFTPNQKMKDAMNDLEATFRGVEKDIDDATGILLSMEQDFLDIFESKDIAKICDILKRVVGKIGIAGIDLCKALIKPIFDFVACTIEAVVDLACTPIHVPLLSDILEIFGIKEFSIADMVTFPTSFLATTASRIAQGKALFDVPMYNSIMNAESVENIFRPTRVNGLKFTQTAGCLLSNSCEPTENAGEAEEYICSEKARQNVLVYKHTLWALGVFEIIYDSVIKGKDVLASQKNDEKKSKIGEILLGIFSCALSSADFTLSYIAGDNYSPMDPDDGYYLNKEQLADKKNSEYVNKMKCLKSDIHVYTVFWKIKFGLSLFVGICPLLSSIPECLKKDGKMFDLFSNIFGSGFLGLLSMFSILFEGRSLVYVSELKNDYKALVYEKYRDEYRNLQVYNSDVAAYIFDDFRNILDAVWDIFGDKLAGKSPVAISAIIIREGLAAGYSAELGVTAALLSEKND